MPISRDRLATANATTAWRPMLASTRARPPRTPRHVATTFGAACDRSRSCAIVCAVITGSLTAFGRESGLFQGVRIKSFGMEPQSPFRVLANGNVAMRGVHHLRHTFCSHLAMRGAPARAIQELAGHQDLRTTQRYMHLSRAAAESAIRLLDQPPPRTDGDIVETTQRSAGK